jgi:hypothetical protein
MTSTIIVFPSHVGYYCTAQHLPTCSRHQRRVGWAWVPTSVRFLLGAQSHHPRTNDDSGFSQSHQLQDGPCPARILILNLNPDLVNVLHSRSDIDTAASAFVIIIIFLYRISGVRRTEIKSSFSPSLHRYRMATGTGQLRISVPELRQA